MKIKMINYSDEISQDLVRNKIAVVIDVFRATSVITTVLANGAKEVIVTREISEALKEYKKRKEQNCILGGERKMQKINGFDYGNSPLSYKAEVVRGKSVILTTTNGTRALLYCQAAQQTYVCSILNCKYVARKLENKKNDVVIICSGTANGFSLEDVFCAGNLISKLESFSPVEINDLGLAAKTLYYFYKNEPKKYLQGSKAYSGLVSKRCFGDIEYCLQENLHAIVPKYFNGRITI